MILEVALLDVRPGEETDFERAFARAQSILGSMGGYVSHELQRCVENPSRYVLLVRWRRCRTIRKGFEAPANTCNGNACSITSTSRSLSSNTSSR